MLPFTTVVIAVFRNTLCFLVRCGGTKVLGDEVVSVLVVELESGWLWLLDAIPELVEGVGGRGGTVANTNVMLAITLLAPIP